MSRVSSLAAALVLLSASPISACPVCQTDAGQRVRDGIFNNEFGGTLLAMALPFLVIAAVVGLIYSGPPWESRSHAPSNDHRLGAPGRDEPGHA